jgi:hypothetical protein
VTKVPITGEPDDQRGLIGARERDFVIPLGLLLRLHPGCPSIEHGLIASTILWP